MPRLMHGFDMDQFLNHCRNTKPPYECPHVSCGRTYRSYPGIQHHMNNFDHENSSSSNGGPKPGSDLEPIPVPMSTDLKMIEVDLDGILTNLSVYDPIEILSKEMFEASLPPVVEEPPVMEQAKTPSAKLNKSINQKTPKNRNSDKDRGVDVQRYTIEEKKSHKLPEAAFKIIPDYYKNISDAPAQTDQYYSFVEKSIEELDEEVEYDMDEEDRAWLEIVNERRVEESLNLVSMEDFELLMDRLEKESFFQAQNSGRDTGVPIDEDAVCCICMDGECQNSNVILFCDMCNLAVHQECYGVPYIPEGQWLCRRCLQSPSRAVDCALCPNKGGAFKQTDDNRWAHVVCAMWIPEVCFANTVFLEPIDSIGNIPPARWKLTCYICVQRSVGACIQCNKVNCYTAFHVTCAQQAGLHMKIDAVRETSAGGTSVTVRKAAYCDIHTPADSDARPQIEEVMDAAKKAAAKAASRQKMKKARKILAEKRSAAPIVSVPILPADRIQHLATLVNIGKRSQFIHRMLAYWTLKRQSRNGVPLLRRLTSSYARRNALNTANAQGGRNLSPVRSPSLSPIIQRKRVVVQKEKVKDSPPEKKETKLREQIEHWQRLRQDLERARLLCELIRKREKMKKEHVKAKGEEMFVKLSPFVHLLLQKIDQLQEKDTQQIFAEPVDFDEVPDYLDVVKHPMDLSTMRQKAQTHQYQNIQQFSADFDLMIENCLTYNSKDTVFYRCAVRLRDLGGTIIRQLHRDVESIGFDPDTGILLPQRPKPPPEIADHILIKEVDDYINRECDDSEPLDIRKNKLFNLLDKVSLLKHPVSRIKKIKMIRREIGVVRRKLSSLMNENSPSDSDEKSNKDDSDMDDSSVIDDEAEPGVPSRPTSPVTPAGRHAYGSQHKLSTLPKTQEVALSPRQKALTTPKISKSSSQPSSSSKKKSTKKDMVDVKQKRIDTFFKKAENSPSSPSTKQGGTKEGKSKFGKENNGSKQQEQRNSSFLGGSRKRGRPPRPNATIGTTEQSKENPTEDEPVPSEVITVDDDGMDAEPTEEPPKEEVVIEQVEVETKEDVEVEQIQPPEVVEEEEKTEVEVENVDENVVESIEMEKAPPTDVPTIKLSDYQTSISVVDVDKDKETVLVKDSFRNYRQGGDIPVETDEETHSSGSGLSSSDSEDETGSESGSGEDESDSDSSADGESVGTSVGGSGDQIPLEPLDLVWAKCRGYPWYPALIINPKMPRTGYFHNRVPIPVPPDEVLAHASNYTTPMYLVLFFDLKRTWQWLPRTKLEPLGENSAVDKAKLVESRKPTDRKAVKKAYEKAILHRCRVTGENTGLSEDSEPEVIEEKQET